jgi:hypothetical protein
MFRLTFGFTQPPVKLAPGSDVNHYFQLVPRLRMSGAILLLPDMSLWCGQGKLYLYLKLTAYYADVPFEAPRITMETSIIKLI